MNYKITIDIAGAPNIIAATKENATLVEIITESEAYEKLAKLAGIQIKTKVFEVKKFKEKLIWESSKHES